MFSVLPQHVLSALVDAYKALADATRLRMLGLLAERPANGRELGAALGISQPLVSHHIDKLKRGGFLHEWQEGREHIYALNRERLTKLAQQQLRQAEHGVARDRPKVIQDFFDGERLKGIPAQRKKRVEVLKELLRRFEPERDYTEREVNALLARAHPDVATLRRELIANGFMTREHGRYRRREPEAAGDADERAEE